MSYILNSECLITDKNISLIVKVRQPVSLIGFFLTLEIVRTPAYCTLSGQTPKHIYTMYTGTPIFDNLFNSLFSLLLYTRAFFAISFAEKMHSFFRQSLIRESFSRFSLLVTIFHPSLINMPIIHTEGF